MPAPIQIPPTHDVSHTVLEDAQGLATGCFLSALGLTFLTQLGLLTGQTAGLALFIAYLGGWSFGLVFTLINLPFYVLAYQRLGPEFTLKSLACVSAVSLLYEALPSFIVFERLNPIIGTLAFGTTVGLGLLACFRHKGSLGGLGVVALIIQDRSGFRAGYVQLIFDACLFTFAFFLFPASIVAYSLFGAVILNGMIAFNHRRDRYLG